MRTSELISRVVSHHELFPDNPRLRVEFFEVFVGEWEFLTDYHSQFHTLPNKATFVRQFPDFPFEDSESTAQWLLDEVEQEHIEGKLTASVADLTDRIALNPREAARSLTELAQSFLPLIGTGVGERVEMRADFERRVEDFRLRKDAPGMAGITTGFDLLDLVTSGTQPGEIEVWFARPGEGKSLMLLHSCIAAAAAGFDVTFVSPEMNRMETGARYDAFNLQVSASGLFSGEISEGEFTTYVENGMSVFGSAEHWGKLYFREAQGHAGRFNTADLAQVIDADRPQLVAIDGLMLIDPVKTDKDPRKRIINLMDELKNLTVTTLVPLRIAHQASRESLIASARRMKNASLGEIVPDLHHLAESGSVEQFANRAIAIKRLGDRTYLGLRKNRNGANGRFISVSFDIDRGIVTDARLEDESAELNRDAATDAVPGGGKARLPF